MTDTVEKNEITLGQLHQVTPRSRRNLIDQDFVDSLNGMMTDETLRESFRDNVLGYAEVLRSGTYGIKQYVNAVKYLTYKMQDLSNIDAYVKTHPDRYQKMLDNNYTKKAINGVISIYAKSKIIIAISNQIQMPTHIINQDVYQKSINVLAEMMMTANSEKCRVDAAAKLVDALRPPETSKIEIDMKQGEGSAISDLRASTMALVNMQKEMLGQKSMNAKEVAHSKIITQYKDETIIEAELEE